MEAQKNNILGNIEDIVALMNEFYDEKKITPTGVTYYMWNKPNTTRVKMLLEDLLLQKWKDLTVSDQKFLMDVFSTDFHIYLREHFKIMDTISDNEKLKTFTFDLYELIHTKLRSTYEKMNIVFTIQEQLLKGTTTVLTQSTLQEALKKNSAGNVIYFSSSEQGNDALIRTNDHQHYWIDVDKRKILYTCGELLENKYKFWDNKIFIFAQRQIATEEQIHWLIKQFLLFSSDTSLAAFFSFLQKEYATDKNAWNKISDNMKDLLEQSADLDDIYENNQEGFDRLIKYLLNAAHLMPKNKKLFILDAQWSIQFLGTRKSVDKPTLTKNGYKEKPAIQIPVTDQTDTQHIIIYNGDEHDMFDI